MKKVFIIIVLLLLPITINANIICNDGTESKTCETCHQGCCSHHDGCLEENNNTYPQSNSTNDSSENKNDWIIPTIICGLTVIDVFLFKKILNR